MIRLIANKEISETSALITDKKSVSPPPSAENSRVGQSSGAAIDSELTNLNIHTIPERFYQGQVKKGSNGKKIVAICLIVLVVLGVSTAVVLLTMKATVNVPVVAPPVALVKENLNQNINNNITAPVDINSANTNTFLSNVNATNINVSETNNNINGGLLNSVENDFTVLPAGKDSDEDGLTDLEESLYATGREKPDTDADSYLDGEEILNLYSPVAKGEKLNKSSVVKEYLNNKYSYSVLYPVSWQLKTLEGTSNEVFFVSVGSEFVDISVVDNMEKLPLHEWYKNNIKSPDKSTDLADIKVNGLSGIKDSRNMMVYLSGDKQVYILTYNLAGAKVVNYEATFMMMVNSFTVLLVDISD